MSYDLTLFGGFLLRDAARRVVPLSARRADALLACLVLQPGEPMPRRRLAALIWPDRDPAGAAMALRQAVHVLGRATTPTLLRRDGPCLGLTEGMIVSDLDRLGAADTSLADLRTLRDRVATGGFLAGLRAAGPDHAIWLAHHRSAAEQRAAVALGALSERERRDGAPTDAALAARARLALTPLSEPAVRALVEILIELHEPAAARQVVGRYAERLAAAHPGGRPPAADLRAILKGHSRRAAAPTADHDAELVPTIVIGIVLDEATDAAALEQRVIGLGATGITCRQNTLAAITATGGLRAAAVAAAFAAAWTLRQSVRGARFGLAMASLRRGGDGAIRLREADRARAVALAAQAEPATVRVDPSLAALGRTQGFRLDRAADGTLVLAAGPSTAGGVPFVGREVECAQIAAACAAVVAGGPARLLLVHGAAGIGKSRLIAEALALQPSLVVRRVPLTPGPQGKVDVLERLVALLAPATSGQAAAVSEVQPSVDRAAHAIAARQAATALVIEDLELAASEDLARLVTLIERLRDRPVLWLLAARPELPATHGALESLAGLIPITTLTLGPLAPQGAQRIAAAHALPEPVRADCIARARGNPLFLNQLLLHRAEGCREAVPASIQEAVLARFAMLDRSAITALRLAAVLGEAAPEAAVCQLGALDARVLETLAARRLVRREAGLVEIDHGLIRESILGALPAETLRGLHGRAASWFRERDPVRFARHLLAAGDRRAAEALLVAARSASAAGRHGDAAELAAAGAGEARAGRLRGRLSIEAGRALTALGRLPAAAQAFAAAEEATLDPATRADALIGAANADRLQDRAAAGLALLAEAEGRIAPDDQARRARLLVTRGRLLYASGAVAPSRAAYLAARAAARAGAHAATEVDALSGLADAAYAAGDMVAADRLAAAAVAACRGAGLAALETVQWSFRAHVMIYLGELAPGRQAAERAAAEALARADWRAEINARLGIASAAICQGDLEACAREAELVATLAARSGARRFDLVAGLYRARVAIAAGRMADARTIVAALRAPLGDTNARVHGAQLELLAAFAATTAADRAERLHAAEALLRDRSLAHNDLRVLPGAALLWHHLGEPARAAASLDALSGLAGRGAPGWATLHADAVRAALAGSASDRKAAADAAARQGFHRLAALLRGSTPEPPALLVC